MIISIDSGNVESAYCLIRAEDYKPIEFGKLNNEDLRRKLWQLFNETDYEIYAVALEMVASYGMPVGASVFDTCVWIGRFYEICIPHVGSVDYIYRKEEKINLCNSMKAKDSNIRQALIDRFGEVGTKKNQGWFYGFKNDVWAAYAVGITWLDKQKELNK